MIEIYSPAEKHIKINPENWDYPIAELDYLLEKDSSSSYVLIGNRLYEIEEDEEE